MKEYITDVLVVGGGLAGARAAVAAAESGAAVLLVNKSRICASTEIMGFNDPVCKDDSFTLYFDDIMRSGGYINKSELASLLATGGTIEREELIRRGLQFDKALSGELDTMKVLGASVPRLIRVGAHTGAKALEVYRSACIELGVKILEPFFAIDIVTDGNAVCGLVGLDLEDKAAVCITCKAIILAAGGCGDIFPVTTYPAGTCGDSYAMAYRAGAKLIDMEFMQYEPCCFVYPKTLTGKIVVTTMLAEGGKLLDSKSNEIDITDPNTGGSLQKSDLALKLAKIINAGHGTIHGGVFFDATGLPKDRLVKDNALFYQPALKSGVDLTKRLAEVAPAAHTNVGGVMIDSNCTSSITGLFAAGEAAGGIHGANRMGGCAGSETLVFGAISGKSAAKYAAGVLSKGRISPKLASNYLKRPRYASNISAQPNMLAQLKTDSGRSLGIIRSATVLQPFIDKLETLSADMLSTAISDTASLLTSVQYENMVLTAMMQAKASILRNESRGVFYRSDHPTTDDKNWRKNIIIECVHGKMCLSVQDIN